MKELGIGALLIIWFFVTAGLALSVVGLFVLLANTETGEISTWMKLGTTLVNKL
jgi:hypothetical protein